MSGFDPASLRWLAICAGRQLGCFASRQEAEDAIGPRSDLGLAVIKNLDTQETWTRLKFERRFRNVGGEAMT